MEREAPPEGRIHRHYAGSPYKYALVGGAPTRSAKERLIHTFAEAATGDPASPAKKMQCHVFIPQVSLPAATPGRNIHRGRGVSTLQYKGLGWGVHWQTLTSLM